MASRFGGFVNAEVARIVKHFNALASALGKLEQYSKRIPMMSASPTSSHLFIVKPFTGASLANLFSTHPPIPERIRLLAIQWTEGATTPREQAVAIQHHLLTEYPYDTNTPAGKSSDRSGMTRKSAISVTMTRRYASRVRSPASDVSSFNSASV